MKTSPDAAVRNLCRMARNCHRPGQFRIHKSRDVTHTFPMRWNKNISTKKIILLTGITLAVYLVMRYILPVAFPFLAGALLAMMLNPAVEKVVRKTGRGRGTVSMVLSCHSRRYLLFRGPFRLFPAGVTCTKRRGCGREYPADVV